MLTLQNDRSQTTISLPTTEIPLEGLLAKEWLLTNGRGGYASSTVTGCNTSSYHGLLVGALNPPVNRMMALSNCLEMLIFDASARNIHDREAVDLATFEFNGKFAPCGFGGITGFRRDSGVHFDYEFDKCRLTKSIYLLDRTDTVLIEYDFKSLSAPAEFTIRPFVGMRNFHALQKSCSSLTCMAKGEGIGVRTHAGLAGDLLMDCPCAAFEADEQWWFDFVYRVNKERGQGFEEDLWTPGFFRTRLTCPGSVVFRATLTSGGDEGPSGEIDIDSIRESLVRGRNKTAEHARKGTSREYRILCDAAEQFVTIRSRQNDSGVTILAGYPWFADWGRDAFIALPGLLLSRKRFDEAKSVLTTFSAAADEGMIPNRFDDESSDAHFNSVDASLWFVGACFEYLESCGDSETFTQQLLATIRWIVDRYENGTRFNIHADSDGLVSAGDRNTQLTWMDAKYDGVAFTPRFGKAVEVNSLWHSALCRLARFYSNRNDEAARRYKDMADKAGEGFRRLFWNEDKQYLNDCIGPDGSVDSSLRPNQIFSVSLPWCPLTGEQQKAVVEAVRRELLTPYGLRTLSPADKRYKGSYTGSPQQRDAAYHQGTVWPYLMGAFVEAYLKVHDFSKKSKKDAANFIAPLLGHLTGDGCLGSVSEIFDGDAPHRPRGCVAQAWSVAELIRAWHLIHR
ncbi:MAG: glycogen debranching enzyme family protein [Sedimentisphaerales bacterium]|nr:glycogen debranching enzyme family protein [Sedimentisphaerales bacterium]